MSMLPSVQYRVAGLRDQLLQWLARLESPAEEQLIAYEEHLSEWSEAHFDAQVITIEQARVEGVMMLLLISSDGWAGRKEVALLPDGSLIW